MREYHSFIQADINAILLELSGVQMGEADMSATFLELGFDSLFLIQFSQSLKKKYSVKLTFRELIERVSTPKALVAYVAEHAPASVLEGLYSSSNGVSTASPTLSIPAPMHSGNEGAREVPQQVPIPIPAAPTPISLPAIPASGHHAQTLMHVMSQQLQVWAMQMASFTGAPLPQQQIPSPLPAPSPPKPQVAVAPPDRTSTTVINEPSTAIKEDAATKERKRFGPYKPLQRGSDGTLTRRQQAHLDAFMTRFVEKTKRSKERQQRFRPYFADPRGIAGFRKVWKEMVYQISVQDSKGSKLLDVDGNEYIDISLGFGVTMFGHSPEFITNAVAKQLKRGVHIGPQFPLAGEVAELMCEMTNQERVTFCCTGSEAVMGAIRLARTYTGKTRIVFFEGAYHGNFEQVLVRANVVGQQRRMSPASPGVPRTNAENALVLTYGDPAALDVIREHAHELAAVLVEPVQSSNPDVQPVAFVRELRKLTRELDIPFIMDEVISGFRAAPGGACEWYGVDADLSTYGKVIGGGMPIGAIAGKAKYMDGLDSGMWQYGDDSVPEADMTFFAGTFVRHPLAMAAAKAVLEHVKRESPSLQQDLTRRTKELVDELNAFFEERQVPVRLLTFSSLFRFAYVKELEYIDMVYYHLLDKGIFTRGFNDNLFLSTAHTDEDIAKIKQAFKETIIELQEGGFLPEPDAAQGDGLPSGQVMAHVTAQAPLEAPLTESQMEIWLASQLDAEASSAFNDPFYMQMDGALDLAALNRAIEQVSLRHESIHARFDAEGSKQTFMPPSPVYPSFTDLSHLADSEQEQQIKEVCRRHAGTSFNLATGPLVRFEVVKTAETRHYLVISGHHIAIDGWSWGVVMHEIGEVYTALVTNESLELPEAESYRDYILAEKAAQDELQDAYTFWKNTYTTLPPALDLPVDRPRPSNKSFNGSTASYQFKDGVYKQVKATAAEQGVSFFTYTLAAFNLLMARLTGLDDIVAAIPTAGQLQSGTHSLVGHCVNLLPLRTRIDRTAATPAFLKAVNTGMLDAYDHGVSTLGGIIRQLDIPRDPSRMPLVEVTFNLDREGDGVTMHGVQTSFTQITREAVNFDIFFNLTETKDGLYLDMDYNATLFDAETVHKWIHHYECLLSGMAAHIDTPIGALPLVDAEAGEAIIPSFSENLVSYPYDQTVLSLFDTQVAATPDAIAVQFEDRQLSYLELDKASNRLAHFLIEQGVTSETLVGVHIERSEYMLVALLGVLKANGAYIPMDPGYPMSRLRYMVEDAQLKILLSESHLVDQMGDTPLPEAVRVVHLDTDIEHINTFPSEQPDVDVRAEHLAYVIYTSGSTGNPKGVEIPHGAFTNFLLSVQKTPGLAASDVLLSVTTLSFDIVGLELFLPVISGGKVVIVSRDVALDAKLLAEAIAANNTTIMQATPATWRLLLEGGWTGKRDLKVLCGGEALPPSLANALIERCASLWNMYGPTETTVYSSVQHIKSSEDITIGRPIANTSFYILDQGLQPVPDGATGQLYIGGDGLARGYLNRPALTAERFIDNPHDNPRAPRLYNTGDLARMRSDGLFECLGRNDSQVKVRGYRIELGEIEATLEKHPSISEGCVIAKKDEYEETRLIAYYATVMPASVQDIKSFMRETLPEYMIPAKLVELDALPRTPNRKIDRNALPVPGEQEAAPESDFAAPTTEMEKTIAAIWTEILQVDQIGVEDNFFDLGGHSLHATRVLSRLRNQLQRDIPLRILFEQPTIAELSAVLEEESNDTEDADALLQMIEELKGLSDDEVTQLLNDEE